MIELEKAKAAFGDFLKQYPDRESAGFRLKVVHTAHVVGFAQELAARLGLPEEDRQLAGLIALLHDIGRFEEIRRTGSFDGNGFDHAACGVTMLFEEGRIRNFTADSRYDEVIRAAIGNHSRKALPAGLEGRGLLHARLIRDADKLDNFRVKTEEPIGAIFPGIVTGRAQLEQSAISDKVFAAVKSRSCVDLRDRQTPLDCWVCILAFMFDLNFAASYEIVRENRYIDKLIGRLEYRDPAAKARMEEIRGILQEHLGARIREGTRQL